MADTWSETSRSGNTTEDKDQYVKQIVGVMIGTGGTGFPEEKETDAGATPTNAITDYIVQTVRIDPNVQAGRVFTYITATKMKAK